MTDIASGPIYPTEWHTIDSLSNIECRQLTDDTYQLRSPTYDIIVNSEGFELYRQNKDHTLGYTVFENWYEEHYNHPIYRKDLDDKS